MVMHPLVSILMVMIKLTRLVIRRLDCNRFDAGWNIGLGVEFGRILVGLDTQLGFCKVMDGNAPIMQILVLL